MECNRVEPIFILMNNCNDCNDFGKKITKEKDLKFEIKNCCN